MSFSLLAELIRKKNNPTVMGLDPKLEYIPPHIREGRGVGEALFEYNRALIDAAADLIPAVKPQSAFYEMYGLQGLQALDKTIRYAKSAGLYVILDVKRGDIGSTAEAYAEAFFGSDSAGADCVTVNPYLGSDGVLPFIKAAEKYDKAVFALVKTSNPSSGELQDIDCGGEPLYMRVAKLTAKWNSTGRCGIVAGATYPAQLAELRRELPSSFFLVPGYGAQGGKAKDVALACDESGGRVIVNSSRGLICAWMADGGDGRDFADRTRAAVIAMRDDLNSAIKNKAN
ncbi:MAG: orotidine-5'-phosphate decarboxylase [Eubacteriales bacterium]|jgi:orotidine-5'-phosphate decarboxylase|nr:orotidine-5'-phosphate decarboxylase [Clostridiales bacterium]